MSDTGRFKQDFDFILLCQVSSCVFDYVNIDDRPYPFFRSAEDHFPSVHLSINKFHVRNILKISVYQFGLEKNKDYPALASSRFFLLQTQQDIKPSQPDWFKQFTVIKNYTKSIYVYHIQINLDVFYHQTATSATKETYTIYWNLNDTFRCLTYEISNWIMGCISRLIPKAKERAGGYPA